MTAATSSLWLVASNIQFHDDTALPVGSSTSLFAPPSSSSSSSSPPSSSATGTSTTTAADGQAEDGDTLEPQDDVFYLSRLNDPTTYFFQWICKRYRLTVKPEPHSCPICLETSDHHIQLSCGHTFCRQCLKAAAECNMSSCALCRKSHTLDPDVLRAQFQTQRFANLSWRLGKTRATPVFSKPSWEVLFSGGVGDAGIGGEKCGGCSGAGGERRAPTPPFCEVEEEAATVAAAAAVVAEQDGKKGGKKGGRYVGPDIGALPRRLLMRRAAKSVKRAFVTRDPDVGAAAAAKLKGRWVDLMGGRDVGMAVLPAEVGAARAAELKRKWMELMGGREGGREGGIATLPPEVGAMKAAELKGRWATLMGGRKGVTAVLPAEVGATRVEVMEDRWVGLMRGTVVEGGKEGGVGAVRKEEMTRRWKELCRYAEGGREGGVGGWGEQELRSTWSALRKGGKEEEEVGAKPSAELHGILASMLLPLSSLPPFSSSSPSVEDCGALSVPELQTRAEQLFLFPEGDEGVGALSNAALDARTTFPFHCSPSSSPSSFPSDVGAAEASTLTRRWQLLMKGGGREGGKDVGAMVPSSLTARWHKLLIVGGGGGGGGKGGNVGAATSPEMKARWGRREGGKVCLGEDVGAWEVRELRERWMAASGGAKGLVV